MEQVRYRFPDSDGEATRDSKYEAILAVVTQDGNKSEVLIDTGRNVSISYAEGERTRLEPPVLAIINNTDRSFWDIAEKTVHGISQAEICSRLKLLGLAVEETYLVASGDGATITTSLRATPSQWKTILARLEMGEGAAIQDACDDDD